MSDKPSVRSTHRIPIELIGGPGDGERFAVDADVETFLWSPAESVYIRTERTTAAGSVVFIPLRKIWR